MTLVDVDEDDDDPLCTLIVSLIQVWKCHICLPPFHKLIRMSHVNFGTQTSNLNPCLLHDILIHDKIIFTLCIVEGKTWTQTRRCWKSVDRWVSNCSNSVGAHCPTCFLNLEAKLFCKLYSGTRLHSQGLWSKILTAKYILWQDYISQDLWSTTWAILLCWKRASWERTSSNTLSGWTFTNVASEEI